MATPHRHDGNAVTDTEKLTGGGEGSASKVPLAAAATAASGPGYSPSPARPNNKARQAQRRYRSLFHQAAKEVLCVCSMKRMLCVSTPVKALDCGCWCESNCTYIQCEHLWTNPRSTQTTSHRSCLLAVATPHNVTVGLAALALLYNRQYKSTAVSYEYNSTFCFPYLPWRN